MQEQDWQDVLSGPVPAGPEFAPIGGLTYDFMQQTLTLETGKRRT